MSQQQIERRSFIAALAGTAVAGYIPKPVVLSTGGFIPPGGGRILPFPVYCFASFYIRKIGKYEYRHAIMTNEGLRLLDKIPDEVKQMAKFTI